MFTRFKFGVLLSAIVVAGSLAACTYNKPVAVDFKDLHASIPHKSDSKMMSVPTIPYCCTSEKSKQACHAYNCGSDNIGCVKWCAEH